MVWLVGCLARLRGLAAVGWLRWLVVGGWLAKVGWLLAGWLFEGGLVRNVWLVVLICLFR